MFNHLRSFLFIPGNNPGMIQNTVSFETDVVILDLEDAVSTSEKDSARSLVVQALTHFDFGNKKKIIRVNPLDSIFGTADLRAVCQVSPDAILLPKAEPDSVKAVEDILSEIERQMGKTQGSIALIPLVETVYAVESIYEILAYSKRIIGIFFGAEDYTADMGIKRTTEGNEIFVARNKIAMACRANKKLSIDTPFTDIEDQTALLSDCQLAKSIGFSAKAVINPRQLQIINTVFSPTQEEIDEALQIVRVMESAEKMGKGAIAFKGKMVDAPILNRARHTLLMATKLGLV